MKRSKQFKGLLREFIRLSSSSAAAHKTLDSSPSPFTSFYERDLEMVRASSAQMRSKPASTESLKFGHTYSDHMMEVDFSDESGWTRPLICPLKNFELHPGCKALHYAVQLFEGMKAYRGVDNKIRIFRPDQNIARMKRTAIRASLPDFDGDELIRIISELIHLEQEWIPYSCSSSLYIRPTMIGVDPTLGVAHSKEAKLYVLTGPVGAYYPTGFKPVSLLADSSFVRAFPGGVGAYKLGCNYAPTILVGRIANELGCQQVLWLFDQDEKLTEAGTMNIFIYWMNKDGEPELVTPPLTDGLILPGVTRDSLLTIAREWNEFKVTERYPTMIEIKEALSKNRIMQVFGAGTACVVSPIGRILYKTSAGYENLMIPTMESTANVMQRFYEAIVDIQYGRTARPEWVHVIR